MSIVALLTDFGLTDSYVGTVKAVILGINPTAQIVDITHQVRRHSIKDAAFLLLGSFKFFPKNTIFLVVVDPGVGSKRYPIAIKTKNYYFVGPDNGVLSLAAKKDTIENVVILENKRYFLKDISSTFHARDIFGAVAGYLSKGINFNLLGRSLNSIKEIVIEKPKITKEFIEVSIIYKDHFGNLVTNLEKEVFLKFLKGKNFVATLNSKKISKIYDFYAQAKDNELFFIEGSFGFLEISLKNKSAKDFLKIKDKDYPKLTIKIYDSKRKR